MVSKSFRLRRRSGLVLAAAVLLAGGWVATRALGPPPVARDLERLEAAGEQAGERSDKIVANLRAIADNIEAGEGLAAKSGQIRALTQRQQRSLASLIGILGKQLRNLAATRAILVSARDAAAEIDRLGEQQAATLTSTITALRELEELSRRAATRSALFAARARYGARLAEDSAQRFSRP